MTTPPALPSLPGLAWSRHKKPGFSTRVASHASGREVRVALMTYPLYEFETAYNGLSSTASPAAAQTGLGASSLQSLMGFFLRLMGQAGVFLYTDPDDSAATGQAIGVGDGATQCFVMGRSLGGFNEPVSWVASIANVYFNGIVQPGGTYVLEPPNTLAFYQVPDAGVAIAADFSFAFQCRFLDDQMDFEEFMASLWKLGGMKFRSIKANTTPAVPPQWYNLYAISGTLASLVADFTTEGGADRYYYDGATCANAAAYETAVGLSESRSSAGYYTNPSGLLASAASNVLRIGDYNPVALTSKGLLLEGAGTNYLPSSGDLGNAAYWHGDYRGIATTSNATTAPDGTTTAASAIEDTSTGTHFFGGYYSGTLGAGPVTASVWAKAFGRAWIALGIYMTGQSPIEPLAYYNLTGSGAIGSVPSGVTATIQAFPNGWYRLTYTRTANASVANPFLDIYLASANGTDSYTGNGTSGAYFWGAQLETASFASSYIPTATGSASRSADSFKRTRTNPTSITKLLKATTPPGTPATECTLWSADDGSDANYIRVVYYSDGHIHLLVEAGGSSQINLDLGAVAANTAFTIALTAAAANFAASINGGAAVSTSSGSMPTGLVNDRLGSGVDAGYEWFSDIALDAEWTNLIATGAQLAALS